VGWPKGAFQKNLSKLAVGAPACRMRNAICLGFLPLTNFNDVTHFWGRELKELYETGI
jgi:hypothetical protein